MTPPTADVLIIGAGVIGASIAFHLTRHGIKPLLIEKHHPAAGSSGACDGLVFLQSKKPGLHLRLALESRKRFDGLFDQLGSRIEFKNPGGMCLIESEAELAAMRLFVDEQRRSGLEVELLEGDEARRREPCLSEKVIAATYSALDSQVNPYELTFAFLRAAKSAGARILTGEAVRGIEGAAGKTTGVFTDNRRISAPVVVNAAGALAADVGRMVGLEIPITPRRGQILVTAAVPPLIRHCLISAQYVAAKFKPELAERGGMGFSLEQADNGNILIGSTREFVALPISPVVTLHNPYNVALEFTDMRLDFLRVPFAMQVFRNGIAQTAKLVPLETMMWQNLDGARGRVFGMRLKNKTAAGAVAGDLNATKITLLPGEVKTFSPYIDPNHSWFKEMRGPGKKFLDIDAMNQFTSKIDAIPGWQGDGIGFACAALQGNEPYIGQPDGCNQWSFGWRWDDALTIKFAPVCTTFAANKFVIQMSAKVEGSPAPRVVSAIEMDYASLTGLQDFILGTDGTMTYPSPTATPVKGKDMLDHSTTPIKEMTNVKPFALLSAQAKTTSGARDASNIDGRLATKPWCFAHANIAASSQKVISEHSANFAHEIDLQLLPGSTANLNLGDPGSNFDTALLPKNVITIPAGERQVDLVIVPIDDALQEASETIKVALLADPAYTLPVPSQLTVTLLDNDQPVPTLSVAAVDATASEVGLDTGTFSITRSGDLNKPLMVRYDLLGKAANGDDYEYLAGTRVIPAGVAQVTVIVKPKADPLNNEGSETVQLMLKAGSDYVVGTPASAVVTIADESRPTITISQDDLLATEQGAGGTSPNPGRIVIQRTGSTSAAFSVRLNIAGTASNGSDYQTLSSTIQILIGASGYSVNVIPIEDTLIEGSETVAIRLAPDPSYMIGASNAATIVIEDNDFPAEAVRVSLRASDDKASESGDTGSFELTRTGATSSPLSVKLAISGSATPGSDYVALPNVVQIDANQTTKLLTVTPQNDASQEDKETVEVRLVADPAYTIATGTSAIVSITDNDAAVNTVVQVVAGNNAVELARRLIPGYFDITRTTSQGSLLVQISLTGTAKNGTDYAPVASSVLIPDGTTSTRITIYPLNDDSYEEKYETVILKICANSAYNVGYASVAQITIEDDDVPNYKPAAFDDVFKAASGQKITVSAPGILANDFDPDGGYVSVDYLRGEETWDYAFDDNRNRCGNLSLGTDGGFTYEPPNATFTGRVRFMYALKSDGIKLRDGQFSSGATVYMYFGVNNAPPVPNSDYFIVAANRQSSIPLSRILANDLDADGDTVYFNKVESASDGTAVVSGGNLLFTPTPNFIGIASISYSAHDRQLIGGTKATILLNVRGYPSDNGATNVPPTAQPDTARVRADTPTRIPVLANDIDLNGDEIAIANIEAAPSRGWAQIEGNCIRYTPYPGYVGVDSFTYRATDGKADSDPARVNVCIGQATDVQTLLGKPPSKYGVSSECLKWLAAQGSGGEVPAQFSAGNSTIDNTQFSHIHQAVDYVAGDQSCNSCGVSVPKMTSKPSFELQRYHRYKDCDLRGSYGPGYEFTVEAGRGTWRQPSCWPSRPSRTASSPRHFHPSVPSAWELRSRRSCALTARRSGSARMCALRTTSSFRTSTSLTRFRCSTASKRADWCWSTPTSGPRT